MPVNNQEQDEILKLLREDVALDRENNVLLRKLYRNQMWGLLVRIVWYGVLIGLPFALYFYVLQPYFGAFGADYETFRKGMAEIPGLKGLESLLPSL